MQPRIQEIIHFKNTVADHKTQTVLLSTTNKSCLKKLARKKSYEDLPFMSKSVCFRLIEDYYKVI